jgi:Carboxypeptidase regulatory-like domain/TonB-dependent Receptor Plug Domain
MKVRNGVSIGLRLLGVFLLVLFAISSAVSVCAQSFRGGIRGEVSDPKGLHVAGAKVIARNLGTSESREVTADEQGEFRFVELAAGDYEVSAVATGLEEARLSPVRVDVGVETIANITLTQVKSHSESVEVVETVPIVETADTTLSQVVDRTLVQELPLNGRDFGKLVALTPGVTVEGSGVAGTEKGFGQFNINGNRDRSNNYTLDGTDNNDPWFNNSALNQVGITGAPATLLPLDAIQEFNLQSQFSAEYGRNSGSIVNIVTRSGSNSFHGSAYEYNRNSAFDARNYFNTTQAPGITPGTTVYNPQSPFNNNNFGGSLGGPIFKDRTFFFLAYEGQREKVGSDFNLTVPTAGEIAQAEAGAAAVLGQPVNQALVKILNAYMPTTTDPNNQLPYTVNDKNDNDNFIVKVDHRFNEVNSIAIRYAFGNDDQRFPLGSLGGYGSGSRLGDFAQISPTRVQVVSGSWLAAISPSVLNEVRFGYSRFTNSFNSADGNVNTLSQFGIDFGTGLTGIPEFDFAGAIENMGATTFGIPRGRTSQTYQALDNFTYIHGENTWRFGGEYRRALVDFSNDNYARGIFYFDSTPVVDSPDPIVQTLANYFLGYESGYAVTGDTARNLASNGMSFFAQDDIRVRPNFTVNAGLRWEYYGPVSEANNLMSNLLSPTGLLAMVGTPQLPIPYTRDLNNFAPRLGFAWNVRPKTVVRAAYGIYYDYIPMHLMQANYTNSAGISQNPIGPEAIVPLNYNQDAYNGTASGAVFAPVVGPPVQPSIFATDHNLRTPYVQSWNLNLQREIGSALAIEAGYVGSKGTRLVRLYDLNQNGINPYYSAIDVLSTGTDSTYEAGQLTLRLQNWHRFSGFSTYTYSKSLDGASDGINYDFAFVALPQDSTNLKAEKGPSSFDTRHRWTTAMNYSVPTFRAIGERFGSGWQLNSIITVQSGRPIDIATDGTTSFGGVQRPDVVPGVPFVLPNWNASTGYLNPAAFAYPSNAEGLGNLGRDRIYGPGFWNVDFSVSKNTKLWENAMLQFRAEIFNIVNHPNFALPDNFITPGSGPAGAITQTPDVAQGNPGLGGGGPRVVQFGLRLQF